MRKMQYAITAQLYDIYISYLQNITKCILKQNVYLIL